MNERHEGKHLRRQEAKKRWKTILAVFLSVVLVMQSSNIQAFADVLASGGSEGRDEVVMDPAAEDTGTQGEVTTPEETDTADDQASSQDNAEQTVAETEENPVETTAQDTEATTPDGQSDQAQSEQAPAEETDTTVTLNVEVSAATLKYSAQDGTEKSVTSETDPKSVDVSNTLDFTFTVAPDDGQLVSSVAYAGTELTANDSGEYTIAAADLTDGEKIVVTTEAVPAEETPAEEAPAEEAPAEPEVPAEEEPAEEGGAASEGAGSQDAANGVVPMSARIAGNNSWSPERQENFLNRYWSGTLSIGRHYYEGSSTPIGETTSVTLDTNDWGGASQTVNVSEIKLDGYDFRGAYYNDTQIQRLRINGDGALQYSSQAHGSSWYSVRNPDDIIFRYAKRGEYRVRWYVNGQLVETDWADAGDIPSYDGWDPIFLRRQSYGIDEDNLRFEGWATIQNSKDWSVEGDLPQVSGNVDYYAVFTTITYFYFLLPEDGKTSESDDPLDYMYAGDGRAVLPDGIVDGNRWYSPRYDVQSYITVYPTDAEIRKGLETYYDGQQGRDKYEATWDYQVEYTTLTAANTSVDYEYETFDGGRDLHIDTSITITTAERVTVSYIVAYPDSTVTQNRKHHIGDTVQVNSTVDLEGESFETDGFTFESEIEHDGSKYVFDGWYTNFDYMEKAADEVSLEDGTKFYARYIPASTYQLTYEWTGLPEDATFYDAEGNALDPQPTLPAPVNDLVDGQEYTIDTTYAKGTTVYTVDGYGNVQSAYVFSGWDQQSGTIDGANVEAKGSWTTDGKDLRDKYTLTYEWTGLPEDATFYDAEGNALDPQPTLPAPVNDLVDGQEYTSGGP